MMAAASGFLSVVQYLVEDAGARCDDMDNVSVYRLITCANMELL